jgi:hypothetical protein
MERTQNIYDKRMPYQPGIGDDGGDDGDDIRNERIYQ